MRLIAMCVSCAVFPLTANASLKVSERYKCRFNGAVTKVVEIDKVAR